MDPPYLLQRDSGNINSLSGALQLAKDISPQAGESLAKVFKSFWFWFVEIRDWV